MKICNPIYTFEGFSKKAQTYLRIFRKQLVCSSPVMFCLNMRASLNRDKKLCTFCILGNRLLHIVTLRCSVSVLEYFRAFSFFSLNSLRYSNDWHLRLGNEKGQCIQTWLHVQAIFLLYRNKELASHEQPWPRVSITSYTKPQGQINMEHTLRKVTKKFRTNIPLGIDI